MNSTKLLAFLLSVIIFASAISIVNATITKEYEYTQYADYGAKGFTFKVRIVIETEADNTWLEQGSYNIDFTITLTYLNQSVSNPNQFYLIFKSPSVFSFQTDVVKSSTKVDLWNIGTLSLTFTHYVNVDRFQLNPYLQYEIHDEGMLNAYWSSNETIYIDSKSSAIPSTSLLSPELIFIVAGIVIGAVVIGSYFIIKTRKRKS